ncbi:MAG: cofactor-independent phosphoglycerate mutase [Actinobacteria bacterium]|nr:cofactor-independent phosphoglycerate mutase [Actinomycetota bacterium]
MPKIKVAVLVPDGAADLPLEKLGGKTPLEAADIPNMDKVVGLGTTGTARMVPPGMPPGSDVANLSLFGYDPSRYYGGRGPIEAANLGIKIPAGWTAFRCNLVTTDGERMLDYSAGHVGQEEAGEVMKALEDDLGDEETGFYQGKSYRNLVLIEGDYSGLACTAPHDITGETLEGNMPEGPGSGRIIELMMKSREVLRGLAVNERLFAAGRPTVDMVWLWGRGVGMKLEAFEERFGLNGGVISAVDLVNGLGRLIGLVPIEVPGATGFLDTNYAGKGEAAAKALSEGDFVYVHVEAPDEASHIGDVGEKVKALERFDSFVVRPVMDFLAGHGDFRLLVCPDHPTLISTLTHDASPVPFAACGVGIPKDGSTSFSEAEAMAGGLHLDQGWKLMSLLTGEW